MSGSGALPTDPRRRDRSLRVVRTVAWGAAAVAAAGSAALSVVAAHAFKGHRTASAAAAAPASARLARGQLRVPPAQDVPAIAGAPAPLTPPSEPPVAQPEQAPAATSGGS